MKIKSIVILLTYLLLLSSLTVPAIACPPPYCGECEVLEEGECEYNCSSGQCCDIGIGCVYPYDCSGECTSCSDDYCTYECNSCQTCEDDSCVCNEDCCEHADCPDEVHYSCIECECICDYETFYTQNTVITPVSITSPTDFESFCVGTEEVSATCTTSTDSDIAHHCVDNVWTVESVSDPVTHTWSGPGTFDPTTGTSVTWTPPTTAGEYTINVTASDSPLYDDSLIPENPDPTDSVTVYVVEVDGIQYDDPDTGWTYIQPSTAFPLYVYKGTTVTFKAIPDPSTASWPSDKPVWGGSSGASGTGETTDVTFNTLSSTLSDYKTVTATCGNTITIYVIVFDFEGVFTPKDDFDGRHTMYYGIEELVELSFETDPWSVTAGQAGGLEWTKGSGPGTLSDVDIDYGTAEYDAGATNGTVWLKLTIKSGPSKGKWEGYQKDVILPSGTRMTRVNPNTVWHIQFTASAGIKLYYWLDPKYVSFKYLTFGEGSCPTTNVAGFYLTCDPWLGWPPPTNSYPNGAQRAPHAQNFFGTILGGNITTGCRVDEPDYSSTGAADPWAAGSYTYVIPSEYIDDTASRHSFGSQTKVGTFDVNGKATNTKGGQPPGEAALNDPTSGY